MMAHRSLLSLFTVLASSALLSQAAQAAVFSTPDLRNPIEARIKTIQQGDWSTLLDEMGQVPLDGEEVAGKWKNGKNKNWKNGGNNNKWKNGKNKAFKNGGGWKNGGFRNGGGWGNGGFRNGGGWRNGGGAGVGWRNGNAGVVVW
jgi:rSAM-associated Gly-rich repeat protein